MNFEALYQLLACDLETFEEIYESYDSGLTLESLSMLFDTDVVAGKRALAEVYQRQHGLLVDEIILKRLQDFVIGYVKHPEQISYEAKKISEGELLVASKYCETEYPPIVVNVPRFKVFKM